ncbi:branched-chain amino acid ABC transporter permease [Lipingzhangella sp. LS1_29]|uniref:Branched-chain amino acid ABC transporter permease n=1 Tax=Lipingzhangella rawalii TaxID=2055835 RepID=A0ABU2H7U0_9ACTN|nr:branched-chain amino acid ABC transporter permease [Lipingzhangella rawalii]MDS1271353.1 branched-chain amino acid ABC transporter permease [Lipingzhangella rawalii]
MTRWNTLPMLVRHILAALAALLIVVAATSITDQITDIRIARIGFYLVALAGLSILIGYSGQISLGHGAFMFVGAYTTALLILNAPMVPLWLNLLLAVAVSCVAGLLVGAATSRLHGPYLAGATLALALGLPELALRFPDVLGGNIGLTFQTRGAPDFLGTMVPSTQWQAIVVWLVVLLALVVLANISKGRLGRQMRALRDDETAAAMCGIQVGWTKVVAFVISAGCGGLAGALQAYTLGTASPDTFSVVLSLTLLAVLVFGGLGSLWGAFWAAVAMVYIEVWGDEVRRTLELPTNVANNLPLVLYGVLLILVIRLWPGGIQGALRSARNWVQSRF